MCQDFRALFNVDSYGIPFNQICLLFENPTLQPGTVIIYTAISNKMSGLNKKRIDKFRINKQIYRLDRIFRKNSKVTKG